MFRKYLSPLLLLVCISAFTGAVEIARQKLCDHDSECNYETVAKYAFAQEGSDKKPEVSTVQVTLAIGAVCQHETSTTFELRILSMTDASVTDGVGNAMDIAKYPMYVTQSKADGSLSNFVSAEAETTEMADFKRGLLDLISYPAHKNVINGMLTEDLEVSFDYVDMHGPHKVKQIARKHNDGITLISTRVYQKAAEVPSLATEAAEAPKELTTEQSGSTTAQITANGDPKEVKSDETIRVLGTDNTDKGDPGAYTDTLKGVGTTKVEFALDAKLVSMAKKEGKCPEKTTAAEFLQYVAGPKAQSVAAYAPPRPRAARAAEAFTQKDLRDATALLKAAEDISSEILRLSLLLAREGAVKPVSKAGLAIYEETKDAHVFEKLAAALAASGRADGRAAAAALAADEQYPAQLRVKALVALLTSDKADESVLRTVEAIANSESTTPKNSELPGDDDVTAAARLVLGGLLSMHRKAPSDYTKGLVAHMETALASGSLTPAQRVAYVSSLGNAAWDSSAAIVAPLTADTEPREVRLAALHALRRLGFAGDAELAVISAARANDTFVSGEAVRLLQTTGNVGSVADLQAGWAVENSVTVTFIEATQELSKSDVHYVTLTEGLYYKYEYKEGKGCHKIEGSAALKAGVYSVSWEILKVGIYAEKKTGERSGIYFFVDISGWNVIKKTLAGGEPSVKSLADLELGDKAYKNWQESDRSHLSSDIDSLLDLESEESADCGNWASGIAGDFGYSRELFSMTKSFWVYIVTIDVGFKGTGRVGLKPGLSVQTCTNTRTRRDEVMVLGGMEPYAAVTINLEASVNLLLVRGGVGGELKVIDIGFPLYGEKYWSSGDLCGKLDFRYEACSGRLYLFADHISCSWFLDCGWKRWGELNLVSWTGWKGTKSILASCSAGNVGFQPVTSTGARQNCERANWWGSFDHQGWSTCQYGKVMSGMYRNHCDMLYCLEEAECCNMAGSNTDCYNANWWGSFDNQGWSSCNHGYYLAGFYRNSCNELYCLEEAKCCRSGAHSYKDCYDQNEMGSTFDREGWAVCRDGYAMTALWRNHAGCNRLYCIEAMRCCTS